MATLAYFFLFLCEFQQGMDLRICGEIPAEESGYVWVKTPTRSSVTLVVPTQMKKQNQGGKGGKSLHVTWGSKVHLQSSCVSISNGVFPTSNQMKSWLSELTDHNFLCQLSTKAKCQLDMEGIDDRLNLRFHPGFFAVDPAPVPQESCHHDQPRLPRLPPRDVYDVHPK